ncbi:MAG: bifunctional diguanylate cyclase/phosphodiesterase [Actinomycetota bacterium]|nr:bifunctional diguanylate cyclase/phosphodiesterase [Actinomycetota bacterium]
MGIGRESPYLKPSITVPLGLTAVLAVAVIAFGNTYPVVLYDSALLLGLSSYATICATRAARSEHGRLRRAWTVLAVALGCWVIGDVIWIFHDLVLQRTPIPSPADFFYLAFGALAAVAMAQFAADSTRQARLRLLLDGTTVVLCLLLLFWIVLLRQAYEAYREDRFVFGLAVLYPVVDLIALAIAIAVLVRADRSERRMVGLLTAALAVLTLAQGVFVYLLIQGVFDIGNLLDVIWALSLVLFAAAALLGRQEAAPRRPALTVPSPSSLWLPYVPLLLAGTIGPLLVMSSLERFLVPLIVVAVTLRQSVAAWENRRLLAAAAEQALRDPLTGLANRTLFSDRLAHAMTLRARDNRSVSVISLDLDDFKLVNDTLGHPAADRLLVDAGQRIAECIRPGDTAARIGGDEFALLVEGQSDDSTLIAQRVLDAFAQPFRIDNNDMLIHPSIGLATAVPAEPDLEPETLIKRADIAMYAAKRSRSTQVHTFTADMMVADPGAVARAETADEPTSSGAAQIRLLGELRHAIDHRQLSIVYQPKIDLRTHRLAGVEALLRWPHPDLGTLSPDTFLPLVRQHGLMRPVTDLVIDQALTDTATWKNQGLHIPVAINLFAPSLRDTTLPDTLTDALHHHGLPPDLLTVEITEDLVLVEVDTVTTVLHQLRHHGIRIAIDDFGSGYSALAYLRDLPIDEIKLDRHFIANVTTNPKAAAVVQAVINLTHTLDITVVAEGVEDTPTATWLTHHHCDIAQGYHFGKPTTPTHIAQLVTEPPATAVGAQGFQ